MRGDGDGPGGRGDFGLKDFTVLPRSYIHCSRLYDQLRGFLGHSDERGRLIICGMNWYREQLERAEDYLKRLEELLQMMDDRYKLPLTDPAEIENLSPDIIAVYQELTAR